MVIIHSIINFIFCLIFVVFSILFFSVYYSYKLHKSKIDVFICEKYFFIFITFFFFIIKTIIGFFESSKDNETSTLLFDIQNYLFNISLHSIFILQFFSSIENYLTFKRPNHMFNSIIYRYGYKIYYELILLILCLGYFLPDYLINDKVPIFFITNQINTPFFVYNLCWANFIIFPFLSIIFLFLEKRTVRAFSFKSKDKLYSVINKDFLIVSLYLLYGALQSIGFLMKNTSLANNTYYFYITDSYLLLVLIFFDFIIELIALSKTNFCEIKLRNTSLGDFAIKFRPKSYGQPIQTDINQTTSNNFNTISSTTSMGDNLLKQGDTNSTINNRISTTLISSYKNDIYLEDYHLDFYDTIINIIIMSMLKVYKSSNFGGKGSIPDLTATHFDIDMNVSEDLKNANTYTYKKSQSHDDYKEFSDVFTHLKSDFDSTFQTALEVDLVSLYSNQIVEVLRNKSLDLRKIKSSLYSHVSPSGQFNSVIGANVSEEYFKNLHNLLIKTYDKQYIMDIYHCSDSNNSLGNVDDALKKYFKYINEANGTFLPVLVGIFKIKINDFQSMLVFVSRNSLVENAPKKLYNYWQLVRFNNDKASKISSSKFKGNTLISDDFLFERDYEIETENKNYNKISIYNYSDFEETLEKDFSFLKSIHSKKFTLLMMYYEFENVKNKTVSKKQIQIDFRPQSNQFSTVNSNFLESQKDGGDLNANLNNLLVKVDDMSKVGGSELMSIKNVEGNNLFDYSEQISITGYEGSFDQFKCMCFFMFENPFAEGGGMKMTNFYSQFNDKINSFFVEYK